MKDYDRDFIKQLNKKRNEKAEQENSEIHKRSLRPSRAVTTQTEIKKSSVWDFIEFLFIAVAVIIVICFIYSCKKDMASQSHYCEWCGNWESCKQYTVVILEGYNDDGSHKYKQKTVYIGDRCINKAKSNGVNRGWIEIK